MDLVRHKELTEAMIEAAMAKAGARVYVGSDRCYALGATSRLPARCTPQGRCRVCATDDRTDREAHDIWLEVSTWLVKLIRQTDA